MQVGDLVKRLTPYRTTFDRRPSGAEVTRRGIITKNERVSGGSTRLPMFWVEWASGYQGWYYTDELEVISESR